DGRGGVRLGRRLGRALLLAAPEPEPEAGPGDGERNGERRKAHESHAEPAEQAFGPGADDVTAAVDEGIREGLRFVLLLARDHREQRLARRPGDGALDGAEGGV